MLEFEDLKDVTLLGHSYGGMVATGVADKARRPHRARGLYRRLRAQGRAEPVRSRRAQGRGQHARRRGEGRRRLALPLNPMPPDTAPEDVAWAMPRRRPQPIKTFEQKIKLALARSAAAAPLHLRNTQRPGRRVPPVRRPRQERGRLEVLRDRRQPQSAHHLPRRADGPADPDHGETNERRLSAYDDPAPARPAQARRRFADDHRRRRSGVRHTVAHRPRAGSAALGAVGLAVSDLWRLKTGKPQAVAIDRHAAAASLRSNTYVLQNGKKPVSWDPLAGHYPTRDGRTMFLHTNHPHHRAGALRISGAKAETREALAEAVAKWDGLAIEEAIADRRLRRRPRAQPRGMERPSARRRRRQAAAARHREDRRGAGAAVAEEATGRSGGVRVLDLTRVLAGPTSGRVLAENGADVLHIAAPHLPYQTEILMDTGHGKRCAWIDLREPAGVETHEGPGARGRRLHPGLSPRHRSPRAASRRSRWPSCGRASSASASAPTATKARGPSRRGFDSIVQNVTGLVRDARHARQAAQPAGPGTRLHRGLSRRARRHGRRSPAAPNRAARGWSASRWSRSRTGSRASAPIDGAAGLKELPEAELAAPADGKRRPVRPSAPPEAGRAVGRDPPSTPAPPNRSAPRRRAGLER